MYEGAIQKKSVVLECERHNNYNGCFGYSTREYLLAIVIKKYKRRRENMGRRTEGGI